MPSVIQLTFDPTKWNGGWTGSAGTPGTNGYDACSVYLDADGVTAWAFENTFEPNGSSNTGNGFARFNLSNGAIIFQGSLFGAGASATEGFAGGNEGINISFVQDDQGFYYAWYYNGTQSVLTKNHVGASSPSSLWNGYMVLDATFTPSSTSINADANLSSSSIKPASDGNRYYIFPNLNGSSAQRGFYVVNVATMTLVGQYNDLSINSDYSVCFMDKFGDFWMIYEANTGGTGPTSAFKFAKWHPADGVTTGHLNVTVTNVNTSPYVLEQSNTGLGMVGTYVPSSHSVILGSDSTDPAAPSDGGAVNVNLSSFTVTATVIHDSTFLFTDGVNTWLAASAMTANPDTSGQLGIPGAVSGSTTQTGGVLNIINPTLLSIKDIYNITSLINGTPGITSIATYTAPGPLTKFVPPLTMQYQNGKMVIVYDTAHDQAHGSPVYIVSFGLCGPAPPLGNPYL